jgi:adenylate kinase
MNRIILLGPPGAGKGTQAEYIKNKLNIPQIATGQILRDEVAKGSELGLKVKEIINSGNLVSDDLIIDIVKARLAQPDCANGYLLDGFPRTLPQAEALVNNGIKIDNVIVLFVDLEIIIKRISGRWMHEASGRTYHTQVNPPKVEGLDDETMEPLIQRVDDQEHTVRDRLQVYEDLTQPLIAYYEKLSQTDKELKFGVIDGSQSIELVTKAILDKLNRSDDVSFLGGSKL